MIPRLFACLCAGSLLVQPALGERGAVPPVRIVSTTSLRVPMPPVTVVARPATPTRTTPTAPMAVIPTTLTPVVMRQRTPVVSSQGSLPGIVQPSQRVELIAPIDGILSKVPVREGQVIRTGDVLLQLDDAMAQAAVRAARSAAGTADIKLAQVDLKLARGELSRMLSIPDPRALAEVELDRAKGAVDRAEATVTRAREAHDRALNTLEVERQRLEQLYMKAPFDGVVIRISTQKGASVVRAMPLITVANLSTLRVELFADLRHFSTLKIGQQYQLHAAAPVQSVLAGKLISREPLIDAATKTFRCVFEIPNTDGKLPAGFTVEFRGEQATASAVANASERKLD